MCFSFAFSAISFESISDKTLFPDLPHGPLDRYRKNAKFDYRKVALMLDGEKCLRFRVRTKNTYELTGIFIILKSKNEHKLTKKWASTFTYNNKRNACVEVAFLFFIQRQTLSTVF